MRESLGQSESVVCKAHICNDFFSFIRFFFPVIPHNLNSNHSTGIIRNPSHFLPTSIFIASPMLFGTFCGPFQSANVYTFLLW